MQRATMPTVRNLVLVGGGHAHVHVLKSFGLKPVPDVRMTLITREVEAPYSGMLPGFIAGRYRRDQCHIDLRPLAHFAGARLIHDQATGCDMNRRLVFLKSGKAILYDVISLDVGATPDKTAIPGAAEHALAVKPIDQLAENWERVLATSLPTDGVRFVTIGAGAAGIELTLAMQYRIRERLREAGGNPDRSSFAIVTAGELLEGGNPRARRIFRTLLGVRGVKLIENTPVLEITPGAIIGGGGLHLPFDHAVLATQSAAPKWLRGTGLPLDRAGFVQIDATLQVLGCPNVFAVGDVASSVVHQRPKAGVFAVRQGPPLARNLRKALAGEPLEPYRPQHAYLSLISTGDGRAIAMRGPWAMQGRAFWYLKDCIDRRWIGSYTILPLDS